MKNSQYAWQECGDRNRMMRRWASPLLAGLLTIGALSQGVAAQTVTPCPNPDNCVQVLVGSETATGGMATIPISFRQGPGNAQSGGIDEIAALAFTLSIGASLSLADCSIGADGLPAAVRLDPSVSNFRVVVENASCDNGRTHCLCPASGTPDPFINLVVYGPNPLPTPGPNPVDIPTLPTGPQTLLTVDLKVAAGASGDLPLHAFTESHESSKPQFTAYLSVGDRLAVDQTCVPVAGQPPCSSAASVSQVAITDGKVTIGGCAGDCNGDHEVTVDELLQMVNISLESSPLSICPVADANGDGGVTVEEIIQAVNFALTACPV